MTAETPINSSTFKHLPVMANEVLEPINDLNANLLENGVMVDATLGGGGHSALVLENFPQLRIIGLDQDPNARLSAKKNLEDFDQRIEIVACNFADFTPKSKVAVVLADLGVSSPQLDVGDRGFSFRLNGPLDMRMNPEQGLTAADLIEQLNEIELADIIYLNGEEKFSRRIAKKIKSDLLTKGPYSGTKELAYAIAGCYPRKIRHGRIHPATRTFQALRIAVNNELTMLEHFLQNTPEWILPGGLFILISFHSLEDRRIKQAFAKDSRLERVTRKPITPNANEINSNPRSRSAKLRIAKRNLIN